MQDLQVNVLPASLSRPSRVCDGYGIWGGGGGPTTYRTNITTAPKDSAPPRPTTPCPMIPFSLAAAPSATPEEQGYLKWFRGRSVLKLPGIFGSPFWDTVALQASSNEPAVLHAILALGAVHKREVLDVDKPRTNHDMHDRQEQFILRQYSEAINCLQPHFLSRTKESVRIALISCLLFVSLEFLRGHYRTGHSHLQNGLKLVDGKFTSNLWPSYDAIDQCIMETFVRLQLQVQMFGQNTVPVYSLGQSSVFGFPATNFTTLARARQHLEYLLKEIFHLSQLRRHPAVCQQDPPSPELLEAQSRVRAELEAWFRVLVASIDGLQVHTDTRAAFSYRFLSLYHTMAGIMVETCLETASESTYEKFTSSFISLLAQAVDIPEALYLIAINDSVSGHGFAPFGSTADIGWIPPLYYTALKCRKHRIRIHAVKLLSSTLHREGIWDSRLAGYIAQEVMKIEERDFYKGLPVNDDFLTHVRPGVEDLLLPALPESYLVKEIEVILPDDFTEKAKLMYKQRGSDGDWQIVSAELDVQGAD
ncbi:MAG: hypothetical protein M1818_002975 [Claussenomyces sp. TS43310]|nr:MAG: hypothetical protein M1818_002975 [Claussenomyces sp. TS43310]